MAQLMPGAVVFHVVSIVFIWMPIEPITYYTSLLIPASYWLETSFRIGIFVLGSTASGMLIHGLHWSVLGALESKYESIFDSFWHDSFIFVQILIGPIKIVGEWFIFLQSKKIRSLRIEENIPRVKPENLKAIELLHEFYLHFSQFYAHSSYSLTVASIIFLYLFIKSWILWGFIQSYDLLLFSLAIYLLAGFMFVIARAQLSSLFNAEMDIYEPQDKSTNT